MRNSTSEKVGRTIIHIGLLVLAFIFFIGLFFITYYFHEVGHMLFGFMDGLLRGEVYSFITSHWINHPFLSLIQLPQQTKIIDGQGSLNFMLGGPFFNVLLFAFFSIIGYKMSKNKLWFLLLISVLFFELGGNVICGTDNFTGNPLSICETYSLKWVEIASVFLFSFTFTWLFYLSYAYSKLYELILDIANRKKR